ncbi:MAG: hypothetical protein CVV24_15555 [Ignavibacteriae bacterium HGW-Ignavibacteriae-3]|nr:MAG: hypothetical protein CVV24_15555 [Ignavibacteriae bacterium HGW-Ignavibacteriae-3]
MKEITDEILNRYIDGDLDASELAEVKNELEMDEKLLSRLRALRAVDNALRQMEIEHAPDYITEKVMNAISTAAKTVKPKVNYFFAAMISIFSIGVIAVLIAAIRTTEFDTSPTKLGSYADKFKDVIGKNIYTIQSFFSSPGVVLTISVLSLILLIFAYFTFESHKNFTKKLNSISNL